MLGESTRHIMGRTVLAVCLGLLAAVAGAVPAVPSHDGTDRPAVTELGLLDRAWDWLTSLWAAATDDGGEPAPTDDAGTLPPSGAGDSGGAGDHGAVVDPDG